MKYLYQFTFQLDTKDTFCSEFDPALLKNSLIARGGDISNI